MERKTQGLALSRREFLNVWKVSLASFVPISIRQLLPPDEDLQLVGLGRVTVSAIGLYEQASFASQRLKWLTRDKLVKITAEIDSSDGPRTNPRWYRLVGGYVHSAYIQRVDHAFLNQSPPVDPDEGQLAEVTVPFSQAMTSNRSGNWYPLYRLYYGSVYWITDLEKGPDGHPWYELTDDRLQVKYCVPISHLRPIPPEEISPLAAHIPQELKRIQVSIADQELRAFEGNRQVFQAPISSGIPNRGPSPNGIPSDTPKGNFHISRKTPSRHMGDGDLTSDLEAYELPGVPWVSFFHSYGIGFHGTYWHDNFGSWMSHGCVNMRNEDALWIYRWTTPAIKHDEWYTLGKGTLVQVI
jgi:hypothetical protein